MKIKAQGTHRRPHPQGSHRRPHHYRRAGTVGAITTLLMASGLSTASAKQTPDCIPGVTICGEAKANDVFNPRVEALLDAQKAAEKAAKEEAKAADRAASDAAKAAERAAKDAAKAAA